MIVRMWCLNRLERDFCERVFEGVQEDWVLMLLTVGCSVGGSVLEGRVQKSPTEWVDVPLLIEGTEWGRVKSVSIWRQSQ